MCKFIALVHSLGIRGHAVGASRCADVIEATPRWLFAPAWWPIFTNSVVPTLPRPRCTHVALLLAAADARFRSVVTVNDSCRGFGKF